MSADQRQRLPFLHDDFLYLITNRHVVRNEEFGHEPDSLRLLLHTDRDDLTRNESLSVNLLEDDIPVWREHSSHGRDVDIAAIPINDPSVMTLHYIDAFRASDIIAPAQSLPAGQAVLIVGFPLGFYGTLHNLPIVRQAVVASDFSHPFKGEQCFLTDVRMHRGTSGAPVVARPAKRSDSLWKDGICWECIPQPLTSQIEIHRRMVGWG